MVRAFVIGHVRAADADRDMVAAGVDGRLAAGRRRVFILRDGGDGGEQGGDEQQG